MIMLADNHTRSAVSAIYSCLHHWMFDTPIFMIPGASMSLRIFSRSQTGRAKTKWWSRYARLVSLPDPLSTYLTIMLPLVVFASSLRWFWQLWTTQELSNGNHYRLTHHDSKHLTTKNSWINLSIFKNRKLRKGIILTFSMHCTVYAMSPQISKSMSP